MAKKAKGKKKKGKKDNPDEDEPLTLEEQKEYLSRKVESLNFKLVMQTNKASGAESVVRELRQRLLDLHKDYGDEKKKTLEIASDMTRQYKDMNAEMLERICNLEAQITDYKDQLDKARLEKEEIIRQKDREIAQREASIQEQKQKMDEMAKEFGQMLKQTLDKMSEKIVITNDWEADKQDQPIVRTFEDFNLGLSKD